MLPDAEKVVCDYLRAGLGGVAVASRVPKERPARFVRAWRTGGPTVNRVLDDAQMTVQAWAETTVDAQALAGQCRDLMLRAVAAGGIPQARRVQLHSLYYDEDPDSRTPRYTFTGTLRLRG